MKKNMPIWEIIIEVIYNAADFVDGILSLSVFELLKNIAGFCSVVFLIGILVLLAKNGRLKSFLRNIRLFLFETDINDKRFVAVWREIITLAKSNNDEAIKKSLQKAEYLINDILANMGFTGLSVVEKIESAAEKPKYGDNLVIISKFIKKIPERKTPLPKQEAAKILIVYEEFLKEAGIL